VGSVGQLIRVSTLVNALYIDTYKFNPVQHVLLEQAPMLILTDETRASFMSH